MGHISVVQWLPNMQKFLGFIQGVANQNQTQNQNQN
jgi:hypothetical protein